MNTRTYNFRRDFRGFTLVELVITLAIATILVTMAIPSFQATIRNNQIVAQTNELITALNLARSEAITQGVRVAICKRSGNACSTTVNWENGWIVFTDRDNDGSIDDDGNTTLCETGEDCVLRVYDGLPQNYTLRTGGTFDDWIAYLPSGLSRGSGGLANDTFRLCSKSAGTSGARAIRVSATGRPMVIAGEDFTKAELACP